MKKAITAAVLLVVLLAPSLGHAQAVSSPELGATVQLQLNLIAALQKLILLMQSQLAALHTQVDTIDEKVRQIPVPVVIYPERDEVAPRKATSTLPKPTDMPATPENPVPGHPAATCYNCAPAARA